MERSISFLYRISKPKNKNSRNWLNNIKVQQWCPIMIILSLIQKNQQRIAKYCHSPHKIYDIYTNTNIYIILFYLRRIENMLMHKYLKFVTNNKKIYNIAQTEAQMQNQPSISVSTSQKQLKQHYLRDQIMDAGYDAQQFVQFLNAKLGIDSDLDKCTIQDLEQVVGAYKQRKAREQQQLNNYYQASQDNNIVQPTICEKGSSIKEVEKVIVRANPEIKEEEYYNVVKCVKVVNKYDKIKNGITCEVKNPERKYMGGILGIGGTSFLCFDVYAYGLTKQPVSRRYSDFIWLRSVLSKFYPSYILPPIPNKKASKRLPRQITKRMRILTYFLNDLVKMPVMLNNRYVEGFLTIKDQDKFQQLKLEGQNKKSYQSILSTQNLTGTVRLQLSNKTIKYKDGLTKFVPQVQVLYKQITRNSKKMRVMSLQKINLLYTMANQFADLFDKTNKFNSFVKTQSSERLTQIYATLNSMMVQWGNSLKKQTQQIQKNMSTFFKYMREELTGFKELLSKANNSQQQWIYQKQMLDRQKQKIFQLRDPKKWELSKKDIQNFPKSAIYDRVQAFKLMLPKESVQVQKQKQNFAYYLSQVYDHGNQKFLEATRKFCDNFTQFSIKMKVNNQQVGAMWTETTYKFAQPDKKPPIVKIMEMEKINQESQAALSGVFQD